MPFAAKATSIVATLYGFCANFLLNQLIRALFKPKKHTASVGPVDARVPELRNAELAALYQGRHLGGDFHDSVRISHNRVLFAVFDIAGRHRQNRNVIATAQSTFRSLGKHLLARDEANEVDAMIEICLELNLAIMQAAGGVCSSPAFSGCYNESLGTVCYFNAGHTPGLLKHSTGITELKATSLPLGLFSHFTPDASIIALEPGATLLLVSRGAVEARRRTEEFGLDRVKGSLQQMDAQNAGKVCAAVLKDLQHFTHSRSTTNDITVLALCRPGAAKTKTASG